MIGTLFNVNKVLIILCVSVFILCGLSIIFFVKRFQSTKKEHKAWLMSTAISF